MTLYKNGEIPKGVLVTKASGRDANGYWEFQFTEATWARWLKAKAYAEKHFGSTLYIRSGWNVYRPLHIQWEARRRAVASGNPLGAAYPGSSSHGGNWRERDCLAIDVDPNGLTWAQVWEACRHAGFECGLITEQMSGIRGGEPWHIIDFNAFVPAPAGEGSSDLPSGETPTTDTESEEDEDMAKMKGAYYTRKIDKKTVYLLFNEISGFWVEHTGVGGAYNNSIAMNWETNSWPEITESHANILKTSLNNVRKGV